jgi:hypothetical protein
MKAKGEGCCIFLQPRQPILANVFLLIFGKWSLIW